MTVPARPTPSDALALARATFLDDRRVDMQAMASELGISRATLHRWVHTREALLDQVVGELAGEFFELARGQTAGEGEELVVGMASVLVGITGRFAPIRGFVDREPALAVRLLFGAGHRVQAEIVSRYEAVVAQALPGEAASLGDFARAVVQVGTAMEWSTVVAGGEPSAERMGVLARGLLVAARAGELPAGSF